MAAMTPMRKAIARQMARAWEAIPHFYVSTEIDMEPAIASGDRVAAVLLSATALTLRDEPALNAHWTDEGPERRDDVNLGVAIAVPGGLMAPAIMAADTLSVAEIASALDDLAERTRAGRANARELTGATFTLSNLGGSDVSAFAGIVNPPQIAILATARAVPRVAIVDGEPTVRRTMTATVSADHRAVDGADSARFLGRLKERVESCDWAR